MSTSVDQKGNSNQVSGKDTVKDGDFEAYFQNQPQATYTAAPPMPTGNMTGADPYMSAGYYNPMSFPYGLNQNLGGDAAWSNGGDNMAFLGGNYGQGPGPGQMSNDYMSSSGVFPGFDYSQQGFSWGFPEYSAWGNGTAAQGRGKDSRPGANYEDYGYPHPDNMGTSDSYNVNGEFDLDLDSNVKGLDEGLQGMSLNETGAGGPPEDNSQTTLENSASVSSNEANSVSNGSTSGPSGSAPVSSAPKKMSWASVASQPAKPQSNVKPKSIPRAPVPPSKQNMDIGTWDKQKQQSTQQPKSAWSAPRGRGQPGYSSTPSSGGSGGGGGSANTPLSNSGNAGLASISAPVPAPPSHPVLDQLRSANQYNPKAFILDQLKIKNERYFVIKSYSEDDIHRSIKYSIWCSTETGNKRLDNAFDNQKGKGPIYLLFSVNGSGHFCGVAEMTTKVDYGTNTGVWAQDKWKGKFEVKWIYVKDVPNSQLRHIRLENNENKPVTNSRDTQEVYQSQGRAVLKIVHTYRHTTSIFDDFGHYERRQEEDQGTKKPATRKA